jgi:hypothetical protein
VWVLCARVRDYTRIDAERKHSDVEIRAGHGPLNNESGTLIFRPEAVSRRLAAQSGVLTIHNLIPPRGARRFASFRPLEKDPRYENKLVKLIIPPEDFDRIRKDLNMFNANASLLFPDLDGLGSYLSWRYTKLRDET